MLGDVSTNARQVDRQVAHGIAHSRAAPTTTVGVKAPPIARAPVQDLPPWSLFRHRHSQPMLRRVSDAVLAFRTAWISA